MTDSKIAEPAAAGHGLTPEQYEACMRPNARNARTWQNESWIRAHNAIRLDMRDFANAIATCIGQGGDLTLWQVAVLQSSWKEIQHQIHHHHENEEQTFFPFMASKVTLPPKMSADHKTLLKMLDDVTGLVGRLAGGGHNADVLRELQTTFQTMQTHMLEHLQEEDNVGLPLMRHHFSDAEVKPIVDKIVKTLTPADMAWFVRQHATLDAKRAVMREEGVPPPVIAMVMVPAIVKYHKNYVLPLQTLIAGATQAPPERPCCTIA